MPYLLKYLSLALFILLLITACQANNEIEISGDSHSIIIPEDAEPLVVKAAETLKHFMELKTGDLFAIDTLGAQETTNGIYLTVETNNNSPANIFFYAENGNLSIGGGSPLSTLYATYEFLEQYLDIRFYAPDFENASDNQEIKLPEDLNYQYTPDILTRTVHARLFYQNHEFADRLRVTHDAFPDYVPSAKVHTFHRFLPAVQNLSEHPEYYALRNGRRISTQLCLSNPKVLELVKVEVGRLFARHAEKPIISVSQDDNTQYCQCDNCKKMDEETGGPAGTMIYFVNEVAKAFPDKTISTLAYQYTRKAPTNIIPEENVLITLCSIECDRSAPIADNCEDFAQDLKEWGALTDNIRIWDYTTQFTNFLAPFPNIRTLAPNIRLFQENNAKWIFEQHSNAPSELFELRAYLTAKLLWNPSYNPDSLIQDFLGGYYEEAGPYVGKYIEKVHDEIAKNDSFFLFLYGDPSQGFNSFLNAENLEQYNAWYDQAEAAVQEDPRLLARVKRARISVDYASLEAARKGLSDDFSLVKNPERVYKILTSFQETTAASNITHMNEMRYSVEEYLDAYQYTLSRSEQQNFAQGKKVQLLTSPKKYADEDPQTLTDGAFGGANFYANWLGFEGNDLEAVIDLGEEKTVHGISSAFLQVVNHIVFLPQSVTYLGSTDGKDFQVLGQLENPKNLTKESKINDIQYFNLEGLNTPFRYLKIKADNMDIAPEWHHGAGLPAWIFVDEVQVW